MSELKLRPPVLRDTLYFSYKATHPSTFSDAQAELALGREGWGTRKSAIPRGLRFRTLRLKKRKS